MWFGTQYGLNRYDGYKFKLFKHDPGRPDSLSGVYIHVVVQGPLRHALDRKRSVPGPIRPKHRDIYSLSSRSRDPKAPPVAVTHISQDRAGMLWLATENGLRRLDPATGRIIRYRHDPNDPSSLSSNDIRSSGEDKAGRFWVATSEGLDRFDRDTGKVTLHVPLPDPRELFVL